MTKALQRNENNLMPPAEQFSVSQIRLEFLVPAEDCELATDAIEGIGEEATVYLSESCGCKKKKQVIAINKGTDLMELKNPQKKTIVSIVRAERVDDTVNAVACAVGTGSSSVIISPVYGVKTL